MRCQSSRDAHETEPWVADGQTVNHMDSVYFGRTGVCPSFIIAFAVTVVLPPHMQIEIFRH
jgi:hypothetical protein